MSLHQEEIGAIPKKKPHGSQKRCFVRAISVCVCAMSWEPFMTMRHLPTCFQRWGGQRKFLGVSHWFVFCNTWRISLIGQAAEAGAGTDRLEVFAGT